MTTTITIDRDELVSIPFAITDAANGLANKRVTWSIAEVAGGPRLLRKVGGLPGSSADITISSQTAGAISGTINITPADFTYIPGKRYAATLWIDDGAGAEYCVSSGGADTLSITPNVARAA
jgi:hypothetical protein